MTAVSRIIYTAFEVLIWPLGAINSKSRRGQSICHHLTAMGTLLLAHGQNTANRSAAVPASFNRQRGSDYACSVLHIAQTHSLAFRLLTHSFTIIVNLKNRFTVNCP